MYDEILKGYKEEYALIKSNALWHFLFLDKCINPRITKGVDTTAPLDFFLSPQNQKRKWPKLFIGNLNYIIYDHFNEKMVGEGITPSGGVS